MNDNDDVKVSDENHHELMDVVGSLVNPEIHENCIHSTGDVIIWIGEGETLLNFYSNFYRLKDIQTRLWRMCGSRHSHPMTQSLLQVKKIWQFIFYIQ